MSLIAWFPLNGNLNNYGISAFKAAENHGATSKQISYEFKSSQWITLPNIKKSLVDDVSVSIRIKIQSWISAWQTPFCANRFGAPWVECIFGLVRNNQYNTLCWCISNGTNSTTTSCQTNDLELNKWYNITGTFSKSKKELKVYVDGILHSIKTTDIVPAYDAIQTITLGRYGSSGYWNDCLMSDVRIYDHCLSPKEVELLARGLVLHYPINQVDGIIIGRNLFENSDFSNFKTNYNPGWDTSLNGTIWVDKWVYYNNGVTSPSTGYHAHIYDLNGTKVCRFVKNDSKRWLGLRQVISNIMKKNTTYTFSCDVMRPTNGGNNLLTGGLYCKTTSKSDARAFNYGLFSFAPSEENVWQRCSYTFTTTDLLESEPNSFYVYGDSGDNGTLYVKNLKLEKGSIATTWTSAPEDKGIDVSTIPVYDTSGYQNNAKVSAAAPVGDSDGPIGQGSYHFNGNNYLASSISNLGYGDTITIAAWVYTTNNKATQTIVCDRNAVGTGLSIIGGRLRFDTDVQTYFPYAVPNNTWFHVCAVKTTTTNFLYVNGAKQGEVASTPTIANLGTTLSVGASQVNNRGYDNYLQGNLCDVRIYATALSPEAVKELYETRLSIDDSQNIYAHEFVESDSTSMTDHGLMLAPQFIEDNNIFITQSETKAHDFIEF